MSSFSESRGPPRGKRSERFPPATEVFGKRFSHASGAASPVRIPHSRGPSKPDVKLKQLYFNMTFETAVNHGLYCNPTQMALRSKAITSAEVGSLEGGGSNFEVSPCAIASLMDAASKTAAGHLKDLCGPRKPAQSRGCTFPDSDSENARPGSGRLLLDTPSLRWLCP